MPHIETTLHRTCAHCFEEYEIEVTVEYDYEPGSPGCRMTANGDGQPPTGPEIDIRAMRDEYGSRVILTDPERERLCTVIAERERKEAR